MQLTYFILSCSPFLLLIFDSFLWFLQLPSSAFSTFGIKGPVVNKTGICVNASVHKTAAVSPAFEIKDYHSTEFSTWAESM